MKKLLTLMCSVILSSSALNIATISTYDNPNKLTDNKYLTDSKYAAIANIIGKNQNFNANDLLSLEEKNNSQIPVSLRHLFGDPYNINNMISNKSQIPAFNDGKTLASDSSILTEGLQIINTFKDTSDVSTIINFTLFTNLTELFGKTFGSFFGNDNIITRIVDNVPLSVFTDCLKNFGTYNPETKKLEITKDSQYYDWSYAKIFYESIGLQFEQTIINVATNLTATMDELKIIVNGLLVLIDFISQFDFVNNNPTPKQNELFGQSEDDSNYKYDIEQKKFLPINMKNIGDLIIGVLNADNNHGLSIRKLLFTIFGMDYDDIIDNGKNHVIHDKTKDLRINVRYLSTNHYAPDSMQPMPGVNFAYNNPIIQIINGILEATIVYLNKTKQIDFTYIIPINQTVKFWWGKVIINNAKINLVKDLVGPIIYRLFNDVAENLDIDETIDSLTILSASLATLNANKAANTINDDIKKLDPWKSPFDKINITSQYVAYPLGLPKVQKFGYKLWNYSWSYDTDYNENYVNASHSPNSTTWNDFWAGTNDHSLTGSFLKIMQDMLEALPKAMSSTNSFQIPNIINVQTEIDKIYNKKVNDNLTLLDLLKNLDDKNGVISTILTDYDQINDFIMKLSKLIIAQKSNASALFKKYVDVKKAKAKNDDTLDKLTKFDDSMMYLEGIYYAISQNYLVDKVDVNALNLDIYKLFGYDSTKKTVIANSFLDVFIKNKNFVTEFIPAINVSIKDFNKEFYNAISNVDNWKTSAITQLKNNNIKYTLTNPDGTIYTIELDQSANNFYKMLITQN